VWYVIIYNTYIRLCIVYQTNMIFIVIRVNTLYNDTIGLKQH